MEKVLNIVIPTGASTSVTIEVSDFTYTATRMGKAPTISVQFKHPTFFQNWYSTPYVDFNNRRFYMKGTPSSSYSNEEIVYKYDAVFVADDSLERTYFIDAVQEGDQSYCSNNSKVQFWGNLADFVARLNAVIGKAGISDKYWACIDESTVTSGTYPKAFEDALISFDDKYIYDALTDDCYNAFGVPFFLDGNYSEYSDRPSGFTGTVICFSEKNGEVDGAFEYGVSNALLSISKENANAEIVNRCTGYGSSENLPWYYPNDTSTGSHQETFRPVERSASETTPTLRFINYEVLANYCNLIHDVTLNVHQSIAVESGVDFNDFETMVILKYNRSGGTETEFGRITEKKPVAKKQWNTALVNCKFELEFSFYAQGNSEIPITVGYDVLSDKGLKYEVSEDSAYIEYGSSSIVEQQVDEDDWFRHLSGPDGEPVSFSYLLRTPPTQQGSVDRFHLHIVCSASLVASRTDIQKLESLFSSFSINVTNVIDEPYFSIDDDTEQIEGKWRVGIAESGVSFDDVSALKTGDYVTILTTYDWVQPQPNLMPSKFRNTTWMERFYDALNGTYTKPGATEPYQPSDYYTFDHPYSETDKHEHIEPFEDIKPSIKGMVNGSNIPIDMFADIAFDRDDDDQFTYNDNNEKVYTHPYFYVKLHAFDGENGFNLFDHAIDSDTMKISMTSGICGGCTFEVKVAEGTNKNPVAVDENGDLIYEDNGKVKLWGNKSEIQARQNDTFSNEVWIALQKDIDTYGVIMPSLKSHFEVSSDDTFVITGINLPRAYILAAEKRLEDAIIKYMYENNSEKFKFSIDFSRIYFEESAGSQVLPQLKEGTKISIKYPLGSSSNITTYVTGITYQMSNDSHLPKVSVDLADEIIVPKTFQKQIRTTVENAVEQNNDNLIKRARRAQGQQANSAGSITLDMLDSSIVAMLTGMSGGGLGSMNFAEMTSFPYNGVCGLYNLYSETDTYVKGVLSIDRRDENGQTILFMKVVGMVAMDNGSVVPSSDGYIRSFVRKFFNGSWGGWALESEVSNNTSSAGDIKFGRNVHVDGGKIIIGSVGGKFLELVNIAGEGETPSYALHTNAPFYSDSWVASGGVGSGDGSGSGVLYGMRDVKKAQGEDVVGHSDGSAAVEGDVLAFNSTTNKWEAKAPSTTGGDLAKTFIQQNASSEWVIQHNLGKAPSVTVVDTAGRQFFGDVVYGKVIQDGEDVTVGDPDPLNLLTIVFASAFSGVAYLN